MWTAEIARSAQKELGRLDRSVQRLIVERIERRILSQSDPCVYSKSLAHELSGYWRLRVENYRVVFRVDEKRKVIQITRIAHRREVYD